MKRLSSPWLALVCAWLVGCNTSPEVLSIDVSSPRLRAGQTTAVSVSASDGEGDDLTYAWSASCEGHWTDPSAPSTGFTPAELSAAACARCDLSVSVSDGRGGQATHSVALCVDPPLRDPPRILSTSRSADTATSSQEILFEVVAEDPAGSALSFSWTATTGTVGTADTRGATSRVAWTAPVCVPAGATPSLTATVTNAFQLKATWRFDVVGLPTCGTLAPVITRASRSSDTVSPGQELTFEVEARDPEGSALTFSWTGTAGTLGPVDTRGATSRVSWRAPSCVLASVTPGLTATATNANRLSASRLFPVTGLPVCAAQWTPTASMSAPRDLATATLLSDGRVLVVGGSVRGALTRVELYDPASGTWSAAAPLIIPRALHTATPLPDGRVLVVGGSSDLAAEVYDPSANTWTLTASMASPHHQHTATPLPDGRVLVAGGNSTNAGENPIAVVEIYEPRSGTWSTVAPLASARFSHTATPLPDGRVLVAGGRVPSNTALTSAEVYDPASSTWSAAASMNRPRFSHTATRLANGKVLVVGGPRTEGAGGAELYDPASNTWSLTAAMVQPGRYGHVAVPLTDGRVLVAGGLDGRTGSFASAEVYDPAQGLWSATASMSTARIVPAAARLLDGTVLVAGGHDGDYLSTAEVYTPRSGSGGSGP